MLESDDACRDIDEKITKLFSYTINIKPPGDESSLMSWKSQLEEDTKTIQSLDKKNHIAEVLTANDLECYDLDSICQADSKVLNDHIQRIVVSALTFHLMKNKEPEYRNGKLLISSKRKFRRIMFMSMMPGTQFSAVGLSTGYLGSLITFSGWNQKMLELCVEGEWASTLLFYVIGRRDGNYMLYDWKSARMKPWMLARRNQQEKARNKEINIFSSSSARPRYTWEQQHHTQHGRTGSQGGRARSFSRNPDSKRRSICWVFGHFGLLYNDSLKTFSTTEPKEKTRRRPNSTNSMKEKKSLFLLVIL
ncbi:hypothetical protein AgCh_012381 [Apium graveolens]